MRDEGEEARRGISLKKMNLLMAVITIAVSALLLVSIFQTNRGYSRLQDSIDLYIRMQESAYDLEEGSEYLTTQVHAFVATGDDKYLYKYFEEAEGTMRREQAMEALRTEMSGSQAEFFLSFAMKTSQQLMDVEYYAMRLVLEAQGKDVSLYPSAISNVQLSEFDQARGPEQKMMLAQELTFSDSYTDRKAAILQNVQLCVDSLIRNTESSQSAVASEWQKLLVRQHVLIILLIVSIMVILLQTSVLVISPLLRAVSYIKIGSTIPVEGSREFRFLAKTYNAAYSSSIEKTKKLDFEAKHDTLTGAYNRSGYRLAIDSSDLSRSTLLLVDIDSFKQINDTYGHEAGDRILCRLAESLRATFRSKDFICRLGGDEFAVIMNDVGPQQKDAIASKIDLVNERLSAAKDGLPSASVSAGAAFGDASSDPSSLYRSADAALYRMKGNGKRGCAFS